MPVVLPVPAEPSKCRQVSCIGKASISMTYEFRTKSAKSRGLEKGGRRERISGLSAPAAVLRSGRECPPLLGFGARSRARREGWRQSYWRREWDSNPRYAFTYTRFPSVRLKPLGHPSGVSVL